MNFDAGFPQPQRPTQASAADPTGHPAHIANELADKGWCVIDDFLSKAVIAGLRDEAERHLAAGDFRRAGVGRGADLGLQDEVRSDSILWLDPMALSAVQQQYWAALEQVRLAVNRSLFLGLYDLEAHFAVYPPGSRYRRHMDQFRGVDRRQLSCVLYLNEDWRADDGGGLRIYVDTARPDAYVDLPPLGGRLVTFVSAGFPHEVLPARRRRCSIAGWFRRRGS